MNIVIFIKQVVGVEQKIIVNDDGNIQESGLEYVLNAHDACAVEEAVRIKEKNRDTDITLICLGPARARITIRQGLASGADRAIHLLDDDCHLTDASANAGIFAEVLKTIPFDLVFLGKQAQDTDMQATAEILSERLGLPMASNCVKVDIQTDKAVVHRQADKYLEVLELEKPCIISVNNDLNNPRFLTLQGIMDSRKKSVIIKKTTDFGLREDQVGRAGSWMERLKYESPRPRSAGKIFEGDVAAVTDQVVELLVNEARVIG